MILEISKDKCKTFTLQHLKNYKKKKKDLREKNEIKILSWTLEIPKQK